MEKNKVEFELIYESKAPDVDKLFNVYRKDPKKARVLYFNDSGKYRITRIVLFKYDDGSFEFCHFSKKFGISTTNKIYNRETKVSSVIYKKKKFYFIKNKIVTQLTYNNLISFCQQFSSLVKEPILKFMIDRFSWIRFIGEDELLHNMSFNTVTRYKLYNLNDALRHRFKNIPLPVIKNIRDIFRNGYNMKVWQEMSKVLTNIHKLIPELYNHHLFFDTCRMAKTLDKKVNCGWSANRLTQEHDAWSKEITNIVLDCEDEYQLNLNSIYIKFAEISGFKLLKTNKDLLREGMNQKHCVGTYINKVNSGKCGIYHIAGYTLELSFDMLNNWSCFNDSSSSMTTNNKYLNIIQFRGKFNFNAPNELYNVVNEATFNFNKRLASEYYKDMDDIKVIESAYKTKSQSFQSNYGFVQQHDNPELPLPF